MLPCVYAVWRLFLNCLVWFQTVLISARNADLMLCPIVCPDVTACRQDVLPTEVYCRAIGALTDIALNAMVTEVKQLEDMSSVETQQLRSLFMPLMMNVPTLFDKVGVASFIRTFPLLWEGGGGGGLRCAE